jgi:thiol-disulfide isomerase/thioredoxin
LLAAVALALASACSKGTSSRDGTVAALTATQRNCAGTTTLEEGSAFPSMCLVQRFGDAKTQSIGELRGDKPMIVNFWASWCVYCIKEMPDLQRAYERAAGRVSFVGLDLLGVQGETPRAAATLAGKTGVRYPLAYDRDGVLYHQVCPCGGRPLMPATVFVRADGTVAFLKFGPLTDSDVRSLIRTHLGVEV